MSLRFAAILAVACIATASTQPLFAEGLTVIRFTAAEPDARCLACLNVTHQVEKILDSPGFEATATHFFLTKLCPALPESVQTTCIKLFDKGSSFAALSKSKFDRNACFTTGMCRVANPEPQPQPDPQPEPKPEPGPGPEPKPDQCATCKKLVEEGRDALKKHASDAKTFLLSACDGSPEVVKETCLKVANYTGIQIEAALIAAYETIDADTFCSFLCTQTSADSTQPRRNLRAVDSPVDLSLNAGSNLFDIACDTCKKFVTDVRDWIKTHNPDLKELMYGVCDKISPAAEVEQCKTVADQVSDKLQDLVDSAVAALDEHVVCQVFCPATTNNIVRSLRRMLLSNEAAFESSAAEPASHTTEGAVSDFNMCDICTCTIKMAAQSLNDTDLQDDVKKIAEGFCGILPEKTAQDCKKTVDDFSQTIFDLIQYYLSFPEDLCSSVGLCKPPAPQPSVDALSMGKAN